MNNEQKDKFDKAKESLLLEKEKFRSKFIHKGFNSHDLKNLIKATESWVDFLEKKSGGETTLHALRTYNYEKALALEDLEHLKGLENMLFNK